MSVFDTGKAGLTQWQKTQLIILRLTAWFPQLTQEWKMTMRKSLEKSLQGKCHFNRSQGALVSDLCWLQVGSWRTKFGKEDFVRTWGENVLEVKGILHLIENKQEVDIFITISGLCNCNYKKRISARIFFE